MASDTATTGRRIGAGMAGVMALLVAALLTLGAALVAPIAIAIAALLARRRGGVLTRGGSWMASVAGVFVVVLAAGLVIVARTPPRVWSTMQHVADSAATASKAQPPPEWMQHLVPGAAAAARQSGSPLGFDPHAFTIWTLVMSGVFGSAMLAMLVGTIGWVASLPLAYAVQGRSFSSPPPLGPPPRQARAP